MLVVLKKSSYGPRTGYISLEIGLGFKRFFMVLHITFKKLKQNFKPIIH